MPVIIRTLRRQAIKGLLFEPVPRTGIRRSTDANSVVWSLCRLYYIRVFTRT